MSHGCRTTLRWRGVGVVLLSAVGVATSACGDDASVESGAGASGSGASGAGGSGLAAASGGGGPDVLAPVVTIAFPPAGAIASDAITVRGVATDDVAVTGVSVGGVEASSDDGFATWSVTVPLSAGNNALVVTATDAAGNESEPDEVMIDAVQSPGPVGSGPAPALAYGCGVRADGTVAHFVDDGLDGVVAVDLSTLERTLVISDDPAVANTPDDIVRPLSVAEDVASGLLYFVDSGPPAIRVGNPSNDSHEVVASDGVGSGPFSYPDKIHYAQDSQALFYLDAGGVVRLDLASGQRTSVGGSLEFAVGLGYSAALGALFASEPYAPGIVRIDVDSGSTESVTGSGPAFSQPSVVAVTADGSAVLVYDEGLGALLAVEPDTGARRIVADARTGRGHALSNVTDLAGGPGWVLALEQEGTSLVAVDVASGDRVIVAR